MSITIGGVPVIESLACQDVPRFALSQKVPVTPEFRADFDKWAREFFGVSDIALVGTDPASGSQVIMASPRAVAQMRAAQEATRPLWGVS